MNNSRSMTLACASIANKRLMSTAGTKILQKLTGGRK